MNIKNKAIFHNCELFPGCTLKFEEPIFMHNCYIASSMEIGAYSYFGFNTHLGTLESIGRFCSVAPGVRIGLGNHPLDYISTHPIFFNSASMFDFHKEDELIPNIGINRSSELIGSAPIIKNDVWIGANSLISRGVTIGNGAVIAANSVVKENVPPYAIVGGTPAKLIRFRFSENIINELLNIAWWDYPLELLEGCKVNNIEQSIELMKEKIITTPKKNYKQYIYNGKE